mmetsp:Transcript_65330/g.115940  ORF Transcript_65330/g.115940 Transcript_65330/m.115940 type:complete len:87 (+) Transcript_65330:87-347(+)
MLCTASVLVFLLLLCGTIVPVGGGPLAYGICQTGCNAVTVACYSAAGATFGTVTAGAGIPAAILACNAALGTCMAACVAAGCTPTP